MTVLWQVRDCRIISDNKTRRSKGIAYIEFAEVESVPLAMGLTGQRLLGVPIIVQSAQAEKNRQASANQAQADKASSGPMRLYVGSLHFNITEEMLRGIFEPFGKVGPGILSHCTCQDSQVSSKTVLYSCFGFCRQD